jgi:molybdopterin-guanine dinucleotide biosynthesis protein A
MQRISRNQITGIVLAGGSGKRMGTEKGFIEFREKPLVQHSIDILKHHCSRIIISANSTKFKNLGYPVQKDILPGAGPMSGIYSCLTRSETDHNLILPCDTPNVEPYLLNIILDQAEGYQVVVPLSGPGHIEPLIGYYHKNNLSAMLGFLENNNYKLTDYIESAMYKLIPVYKNPDFYDTKWFLNINTPKDLTH